MKRFLTMCATIGAGLLTTSFVLAAEPQLAPPTGPQPAQADDVQPAKHGKMTTYFEDAGNKKHADANIEQASNDEKSSCGCESSSCGSEAPSCGSETGCGSTCGCDDNWCDLGLDCCWPFCCCCKPGDPCTLQKHLTPCCTDVTYGGFTEIGYHSQNTGLSVDDGDQLDTNDYPGRVQLQQQYFYLEKKAKTDSCCCDWGYRGDIVYGTNGDTAQAFGNQNNGWDKLWDHGVYGWAIPQLYAEVGYNDWDIKMGHFYTPNAYEVYPANGNFFYSHSLSWYNSEPITHTGFMATKKVNECFSWFGGYTLGWDTAWDAFDGGSNYLGGFTYKVNKDLTFIYGCTAGNLGFRSDGEFGYNHSIVIDYKMSSKWEYVMDTDLVTTDGSFGGNGVTGNGHDFEVANYLFYTINDCWKMGTRAEWWKSNQVTGQDASFYELTYGFNYKANANLVVRPEVRYDWAPGEDAVANAQGKDDFNKVIFGIDAILTF